MTPIRHTLDISQHSFGTSSRYHFAYYRKTKNKKQKRLRLWIKIKIGLARSHDRRPRRHYASVKLSTVSASLASSRRVLKVTRIYIPSPSGPRERCRKKRLAFNFSSSHDVRRFLAERHVTRDDTVGAAPHVAYALKTPRDRSTKRLVVGKTANVRVRV